MNALAYATNKYVIGDFNLQRNLRYSAGVDQVLSPLVRVNVLYNYIHLQQQPRGKNVNPLVDGVRPDPRFANVIEAVTDTQIRRHEVFVNAIVCTGASRTGSEPAAVQLAAADAERRLHPDPRAQQQRRPVGGIAQWRHHRTTGARAPRISRIGCRC